MGVISVGVLYNMSHAHVCDVSHHSPSLFSSRPDRNAEREMNTETFGVSNFRGHRRYQGRGRGRGRGRGYYGSRGGQRL